MRNSVIAGYRAVRAALADPGLVVPPVPPATVPGGVAWLRANVARFSHGPDHHRRRSSALEALAGVPAGALRSAAFERTSGVLRRAAGQPVDLMASVARVVPVEVLAEALGLPGGLAGAVATVARAYHPGCAVDPVADRAVADLVAAAGGVADEAAAARIGLLVQACDATAGLIGSAALALLRAETSGNSPGPMEVVLAETLRDHPPVLATRRRADTTVRLGDTDVEAGTLVVLDLAAAAAESRDGGIAFGSGPRACPGRDHAVGIAAGVLDALRGLRLLTEHVDYEPSPNLRIPVSVLVVAR